VCINHLSQTLKTIKLSLDLLKIKLDKKLSVQSPEQYFYDGTWQVKMNTRLNYVKIIEVRGNFHVVIDRKKVFGPCSQLKHTWGGLCAAAQGTG